MPTREEVISFVANNLGDPQLIFDTASQYGVTPEDIASFTGYPLMQVYSYFNDAGITNPSRTFSGGDVSGFVQENLGDPDLIYQAMRFYGLSPDYIANATGYSPQQVTQYFSNAGISDFGYVNPPTPGPGPGPVTPPTPTPGGGTYIPYANAPVYPQIDNTQNPGAIARQLHDHYQQQRQISPQAAALAQTYGYGTGPAYAPQMPFYARFGGYNMVSPDAAQAYLSAYPDAAAMYSDPENPLAVGRTPDQFVAMHYDKYGKYEGYASPFGEDPLFTRNFVPRGKDAASFTPRAPGSSPVVPVIPGFNDGTGTDYQGIDHEGEGGFMGSGGYGDVGPHGEFGEGWGWGGYSPGGEFGEGWGAGDEGGASDGATAPGEAGYRRGGMIRRR